MIKIPMYRQIASDIKSHIAAGRYQQGEPLPTEAGLREEFSVSRVTIRQAIKLLADEGILESIQGSGTYVRRKKVAYDIYRMTSMDEKLEHMDVSTHSEVLTFEVTQPSEEIASALNLTTEDRIYYVKRIRFIDDSPVTLEETWMPLALFPDLTFQVMQGSKYRYIEEDKGMVIDCSEQEIIPVMPSEDAVKWLQTDPSQPILEKITRSFLQDGTVFELSRNYFRSSDYKFTLIAKRYHRQKPGLSE